MPCTRALFVMLVFVFPKKVSVSPPVAPDTAVPVAVDSRVNVVVVGVTPTVASDKLNAEVDNPPIVTFFVPGVNPCATLVV